jgi:hypothetical protein
MYEQMTPVVGGEGNEFFEIFKTGNPASWPYSYS